MANPRQNFRFSGRDHGPSPDAFISAGSSRASSDLRSGAMVSAKFRDVANALLDRENKDFDRQMQIERLELARSTDARGERTATRADEAQASKIALAADVRQTETDSRDVLSSVLPDMLAGKTDAERESNARATLAQLAGVTDAEKKASPLGEWLEKTTAKRAAKAKAGSGSEVERNPMAHALGSLGALSIAVKKRMQREEGYAELAKTDPKAAEQRRQMDSVMLKDDTKPEAYTKSLDIASRIYLERTGKEIWQDMPLQDALMYARIKGKRLFVTDGVRSFE